MNGLGIRASAKKIYYSIIQNNDDEYTLLTTSELIVPQALSVPDRLSFIRTNFLSIIKEYDITNSGIRLAEITTPRSNINSFIERWHIEGVIQELLSNCAVEKYFAGRKNTISSLLNEKVTDITKWIEGENCYGIEDWKEYCKEERESILIALASFNVQ